METGVSTSPPTRWPLWRLALAAALIGLSTWLGTHVWLQAHLGQDAELDLVWQGVLDGTPHWRAYQNRLMGPWLVQGLSVSGLGGLPTFVALSLLLGFGALCLSLLQRHTEAWSAFGMGLALMLWWLPMHHWSAPWDLLDMLFLLALCLLVARGAPPWQLLVLYGVALWSRESALIVCLYLALCALHGRRWRLLAVAVVAGIAGLLVVHGLREALFRESPLPGVGWDEAHRALGNHNNIAKNLNVLLHAQLTPMGQHALIAYAALLLLHGTAMVVFWRRGHTALALLCLTLLAYLGSMLVFGYVVEGRLYQPLALSAAWLFCEMGRQSSSVDAGRLGTPTPI